MKVLLFVTGLGMGGAEKVVCELADKLYEKGIDVKIVYFNGEIICSPTNDIPVIYFPIKKNIFNLKQLFKFVKDERPDVIHSHLFHANIFARLCKFISNEIKIICTSHSNFEGGKLKMLIYRLTENMCDIHTNVTNNASLSLMKAGAVKNKKILTVYNGINIEKYKKIKFVKESVLADLGLPSDSRIIISIGRLCEPKDYPTLLKAFKIVKESYSNTYLLIAGDGPLKNELLRTCESYHLSKNVIFLGIRKDIPLLLNVADVFVSTSAWEGFGLAILEAMICNKSIIATKTDGALELLPASSLVDIGDYVMIANRLIEELSKYNVYHYDNIDNFDWDKIVLKWEDLYKKKSKLSGHDK